MMPGRKPTKNSPPCRCRGGGPRVITACEQGGLWSEGMRAAGELLESGLPLGQGRAAVSRRLRGLWMSRRVARRPLPRGSLPAEGDGLLPSGKSSSGSYPPGQSEGLKAGGSVWVLNSTFTNKTGGGDENDFFCIFSADFRWKIF